MLIEGLGIYLQSRGAPQYELVLHEWYHQVEMLAAGHLGAFWIPSNHAVLELDDGRRLDPRAGADAGTSMLFYEEALGRRIPPEFWGDLLTRTRGQVRPVDGNLAYAASATSQPGLQGQHLLNDAILDWGSYINSSRNAYRTDPIGTTWQLEWPSSVSASRVVATLTGHVDDRRPSVTGFAVEGRSGGQWSELAVVHDNTAVRAEVRFDTASIDGLRIRVLDVPAGEREAHCRELEVYSD